MSGPLHNMTDWRLSALRASRSEGSLRRLVLRLLGFKPIEPHNLGGGWRLYEDGHGFLSALNRDNFTGWYLITDKHGRPFRPQNAGVHTPSEAR